MCLFLVGMLAIAAASPAIAERDFSGVEIETIQLGSGLAVLRGAGGNVGISTGPDGVFLIDDQYAPLTERIRAAVERLSRQPIRFVLNTHWHGDHTGGNENLGKLGALILAQHRVRERLATRQASRGRTIVAAPESALPVVTFEQGVTLHLNGQTIEAIHVATAHTDGDSIVHFHEADVIHMGDTFFAGMYPYIDRGSGGRVEGMIAAADRGLEIAGPETRIIPGHGALSDRRDLAASRDMLVAVRDRVRKMIDQGADRDAVLARRPSQDFEDDFGGGFLSASDFVGIVYDDLSSK